MEGEGGKRTFTPSPSTKEDMPPSWNTPGSTAWKMSANITFNRQESSIGLSTRDTHSVNRPLCVLNVLDSCVIEKAPAIPFNGMQSADRDDAWVEPVEEAPDGVDGSLGNVSRARARTRSGGEGLVADDMPSLIGSLRPTHSSRMRGFKAA